MSDSDKNNNDGQHSLPPTDLKKKKKSGEWNFEQFYPDWFWRMKILREQEARQRDYIDAEEDLQSKQKQEQAAKVAVDADLNSSGHSPPIMMSKSETATDVLAAPKQKKGSRLSFKKLIRRGGGGNSKRR